MGAFAVTAALVLSPAVALAQAGAPAPGEGGTSSESEDTFFLPLTERRFVLPSRILLPYAVFVDELPAEPEASNFLALNLGVLFGFAGRWMVDAVFAPLVLSEPFHYGNPELGLAYQIVDSRPFELGVMGRAFFSSTGVVFAGVEPGAFMLFRSGHARLDVRAFLPISTSGQPVGVLGVDRVGLRVPVSGLYQLNPHFHVGVNTGVRFSDLGEASDTFAVPLGVTAGFSTNIHGFWIDVIPFFSFPAFYGKGGVNTDMVELSLILDFSKNL
ncbi:hypothetical protein [Vitiosangium sp. GDMCC 1.1324]|uniref:hypothetical protein n=1 Tax=Vitiosangium sp. (strain GDMCC 1.1324) TaxID=2138576 RepID=UPI000D39D6B3|nr:hypothetical protein [Vitiosangium sp. GDMCC 1.1324]PTL81273.1 hypothetical protein DAT35_24470 [Vitiosangium sp. GDMCC 1.1324]